MKAACLILLAASASSLVINTRKPTLPPMGYNTWNDKACGEQMTEANVMLTAKKMQELGLQDLGYKTITLDDCWMAGERNKAGELQAHPRRFSSGMKKLSDDLHAKGYKFGIYTSRGQATCSGQPSSLNHEKIDAQTFAKWEVDYLKNDGCGDHDCWNSDEFEGTTTFCTAEGRAKALDKYALMRKELNETGRKVHHSISGWQPWYAQVGHLAGDTWRVADDIREFANVYATTRVMEQLTENNGKYGWNDPDMLVGSSPGSNIRLEPQQSRAQFSLWAVMGAPLILGSNMQTMSDYDRETYTNKQAIMINQDPLGKAGAVAFSNCPAYPKFHTKMDGKRVDFKIETSHMPENDRVACGYNSAKDCASCGNQKNCHGSCSWDASEEVCGSRSFAVEEDSKPYVRLDFHDATKRQCQQAWAKPLSTGDIGVTVVNFAAEKKTLSLKVTDLMKNPPAQITVENLWTKEKQIVKATDSIELSLEKDGGHQLLMLKK